MTRLLLSLVILIFSAINLEAFEYPKKPFDIPKMMTSGFPDKRYKEEKYHLGINKLGPIDIDITDTEDPRIGKVKSITVYDEEKSHPVHEVHFQYRDGAVETLDQSGSTQAVYCFDKGRITHHKRDGFETEYHWSEGDSHMNGITMRDSKGNIVWNQEIVYDEEGRVVQDSFNVTDSGTDLDPSFTRHLSYNDDGTVSAVWSDDGHYVCHNYDHETGQLLRTETPEYEMEAQFDEQGNTTSLSVIDRETGKIYGSYVVMLPDFSSWKKTQKLTSQDPPALLSLHTLWQSINAVAQYLNQSVNDELNHCIETYKIVDTAYQLVDDVGCELLGPFSMRFFGFRHFQSETGVYGEGVEPAKFRITFVNGILTTMEDLKGHMQLISEAHGGINVHYCYVGSKGWTNDLVRSSFCKLGVISPEAEELAQIWRDMIEELGGTESGGVIFHYAHSLGGTETHLAKFLLSPEELKMIRVITFGSPTLIPNEEFHSVMNLISCRDAISALDPIGFFSALLFDTNSFFVGSHYDGPPIVDHPFLSYWTYLREHFWDEFEELIEELK